MKSMILKRLPVFLCLVFSVGGCASSGYNKHANDFYEQGLVWFEQKEYQRASESFTKVLEMAPYGKENYKVHYNRGMAYLRNRQYEKAIYDFTKAIEMAPEKDKDTVYHSYGSRGDSWQNKGEYRKAIDDYDKALQMFPRRKDARYVYLGRAWAALRIKKYEDAIADFTNALIIDPEMADAYYGRGLAWNERGDPQRALQDAKEAVKLRPANREYDDLVYQIESSRKKP
jgi:tetratricopeptide (TPR) repeat protein